MDWKEFLKPTMAKLLMAALLFILFVPCLEVTFLLCPSPPPGEIILCMIGNITTEGSLFEVAYASLFVYSRTPLNLDQILFVNAIIGLLASYAVSCLLAFIYSKLAKRKK